MTGIILQARMGSSRLPGKILKKLDGDTMLGYILNRLGFLKQPVKVVVATSYKPGDDVVEAFCIERKAECFRGSEDDVLERYYLCASKYGFKNIVRLTGDNPFVDIEELDNLIALHLKEKADYTHSFSDMPVGCGAEAFSFKALEISQEKGVKENHREHVNEYIHENPGCFKIKQLEIPEGKRRPDIRLTVDTEEDYKKACFIVQKCGDGFVPTEKAIELCSQFV